MSIRSRIHISGGKFAQETTAAYLRKRTTKRSSIGLELEDRPMKG